MKVSDVERVGELLVELKVRSETLMHFRHLTADLGDQLRIDVAIGTDGPEHDLVENYRLTAPAHLNLSPLSGCIDELLRYRVDELTKQLSALGVTVDG